VRGPGGGFWGLAQCALIVGRAALAAAEMCLLLAPANPDPIAAELEPSLAGSGSGTKAAQRSPQGASSTGEGEVSPGGSTGSESNANKALIDRCSAGQGSREPAMAALALVMQAGPAVGPGAGKRMHCSASCLAHWLLSAQRMLARMS